MNTLRIDFVSDISCPWCVIGLKSLEQALINIGEEASVSIHFQPFELNPQMAPEGEEIGAHLQRKYGASEEQSAQTRSMIAERGAQLGFRFDLAQRSRIYNTFDAHRLLHWAELQESAQADLLGVQRALQLALFTAYFTHGLSPASHEVLAQVAGEVGLEADEALEVLASGAYGDEVREREQFFQRAGINSVPAIIINQRHLISGGQPPEVFEQALRDIAAMPNAD